VSLGAEGGNDARRLERSREHSGAAV
jgi:hypothetical protein